MVLNTNTGELEKVRMEKDAAAAAAATNILHEKAKANKDLVVAAAAAMQLENEKAKANKDLVEVLEKIQRVHEAHEAKIKADKETTDEINEEELRRQQVTMKAMEKNLFAEKAMRYTKFFNELKTFVNISRLSESQPRKNSSNSKNYS